MSRTDSRYRLLSPLQRKLYRVLLVLGVIILANSLYLYGYTLWQDFSDARAKMLTSYQWMLVTHFAVGILVLGLAVVFAVLHFRRVRRHKNKRALATGATIVIATVTLLVSGLLLLKYANSEENKMYFHVHRLAGLGGVIIYLVHRWMSQHNPTQPRDRWRMGAVIGAAALVAGTVHMVEFTGAETPPGAQVQALAPLDVTEDPFIPFEPLADVDEDATFFPSPATLASGEKLDPSVLRPGPQPDPADLEREFQEKGFTSDFAIGAEDCRLCHQDIVEQWEMSAHRFSSFNNPFYTASVLGLRKRENGIERSHWCGGCHDPGVMLAGNFEDEIDRDSIAAQAGLTCTTCHQINNIHNVTGNGNYELADNGLDPYLFAGATEGWELEVRKYLIKARPRDHKDFFMRPYYREPEYCATCHKVSLDEPVNHYKWIRGQNEYDNWHDSGVSRNAARTFYLPPTKRTCHDCHMPLVPAEKGDLAATDGMVRSHHFPAVNTALPHVRGDKKALEAVEKFMQSGKLRVDLFAIEHPRDGLIMDPRAVAPELRPGDEIVVYVVVRNLGVGHTFPGGTNDSNQGWVRFEAKDDSGNVLRTSGEIDEEGFLDEEAHEYKVVMLQENGEPAMERNAHDFHVAGLVRVIPPGNVDIARYSITVPDAEELVVDAKLLWRKFNRTYTLFSYAELPADPPDLPVTEIAGDALTLKIGAQAGANAQPPADWIRYNDLGIGLLRQGDSRGALEAFAKVAELVPDRVDGFRNQARVHLSQGDPEPVRELLEECEERLPGDPQTKLWWAEYLKLEGELAVAAEMYRGVLAAFPEDRNTWGRLADVLYRLRRYDESLAAALKVLQIDPEDVQAHYQRMLIYRAKGDSEKAEHARRAFEKYRIDDNAPQIVKQWRLNDPIANREVEPRHVH